MSEEKKEELIEQEIVKEEMYRMKCMNQLVKL